MNERRANDERADQQSERRRHGEFIAEDLLSFRVVGDIDVSSDGEWLLYTLQEIDSAGDRYLANHWLVATRGGAPKQLTFGHDSNSSARFSPDGARIAFLSNRAGGPSQLYVLSLSGGEAAPITALRGGAGEPVWSPDGSRIAFAAQLASDEPQHAPRVVRKLVPPGFAAQANAPTPELRGAAPTQLGKDCH